jgi:hypothetical protein
MRMPAISPLRRETPVEVLRAPGTSGSLPVGSNPLRCILGLRAWPAEAHDGREQKGDPA